MSDFATWVERNKGLWRRVYDEVIAPDFEKEWKKSTKNAFLMSINLTNNISGEENHKDELKQSVYTVCACEREHS